jgi:hypothetical protein
MYYIYTAVLRARLLCTLEKITIFTGALHLKAGFYGLLQWFASVNYRLFDVFLLVWASPLLCFKQPDMTDLEHLAIF